MVRDNKKKVEKNIFIKVFGFCLLSKGGRVKTEYGCLTINNLKKRKRDDY